MAEWRNIKGIIKDFLTKLVSKEFLVFLFFLAVSTIFWFISALNNVYEKDFPIPIRLTEVPENMIITEDLPDSVHVTVKDKGFSLLDVMLKGGMKPINISFRLYTNYKGKGAVTPSEIQKIIRPRFSETAIITAVKASHWEFLYNHGKRKKVPILLDGSITPKQNYYITHYTLTPDSAIVYASDAALDTIKAVYTSEVHKEDISEPTTFKVSMAHIYGAKVIPSEVKLSLITDQLTETIISIPIRTINVPENVQLKTFPANVDVRVAVGLRSSGFVKPELFNVVADYNDLTGVPSDKLPIKITSMPKGIVKATLNQNKVDYLVEK